MTPTGLEENQFLLWDIIACDLIDLLILSGSCLCALFRNSSESFSSDPTMPISIMAASTAKTFFWEVFPPMPTCRVYCTPAFQDGHLFVVGGCSKAGVPLDTVEMIDVASQKWMTLPPLPTARAGAAAAVVEKQVFIIGGMDSEQSPQASVEIYNTDEGKWERKADLGQPSMGITAIESEEKRITMYHLGQMSPEATGPVMRLLLPIGFWCNNASKIYEMKISSFYFRDGNPLFRES